MLHFKFLLPAASLVSCKQGVINIAGNNVISSNDLQNLTEFAKNKCNSLNRLVATEFG